MKRILDWGVTVKVKVQVVWRRKPSVVDVVDTVLVYFHIIHGGFHKWGYRNSWMVYKVKSHRSKWMMTGGTPMNWTPPCLSVQSRMGYIGDLSLMWWLSFRQGLQMDSSWRSWLSSDLADMIQQLQWYQSLYHGCINLNPFGNLFYGGVL